MMKARLSLSIACLLIAAGRAAGQSCSSIDSSRIAKSSFNWSRDSASAAIDRAAATGRVDDLKDAIAGMISLSYSDSTHRRNSARDDQLAHNWIKLIAVGDSMAEVFAQLPGPGNLIYPSGPASTPNIDPKDIPDSAVRAEYEPRFRENERRRNAAACRFQLRRAMTAGYGLFFTWTRNNYKNDPAAQQAFIAEAMSHHLSADAMRQIRLAFLGLAPRGS